MSDIYEQLQMLLNIEDQAERQTTALHWWDGLNEEQRQDIRAGLIASMQQVLEFWIPIATQFGTAGQKALEIWQAAIEADPEFRVYIAALRNEQPANA